MRAPGIDAEAALAAHPLHVILVEDLENQAEAVFPVSSCHCRSMDGGQETRISRAFFRSSSSRAIKPGLDGLAEAHVVGNEEVYPRQQESLLQAAQADRRRVWMPARKGD